MGAAARFFKLIRKAGHGGFVICILCMVFALVACSGSTLGQKTPQAGEVSGQPTNTPIPTSCGDGLCEKGEEDTCCTDCGCQDPAKICDRYIVKCIDKVVLSDEARQEILSRYKQWPLIEETDDVQANEAVKVFRFNCGDQSRQCVHIVYVDRTGKVIQEQETK